MQRFFAPGRTELAGNHTDHQLGRVLAASVDVGITARATRRRDRRVCIHSKGYRPFTVALDDLAVDPRAYGKPWALVRGMAAAILDAGGAVGGFEAWASSALKPGGGLSSSAAFEILVGRIFNALYNGGAFSPEQLARFGQQAENRHFGKPSGLMDQLACALDGAVYIDFAAGEIAPVAAPFADMGLTLSLTDTGGSHAGLTAAYAALPADMCRVARRFGAETLSQVDPADFYAHRQPGLADDRAAHFFEENARVPLMRDALVHRDAETYLRLMNASGRSSEQLLRNIRAPGGDDRLERGLARAAALLDGVTDPEEKRRIIGTQFWKEFFAVAQQLECDGKPVKYLAQGTIYPDIIESGARKTGGKTATIKSHHNLIPFPEGVHFDLIEPLDHFFKDEVRALGLALGLPGHIVFRQPFPGPGLAIRIIGAVDKEKLEILKNADAIVREELDAYNQRLFEQTGERNSEHSCWQYFAVLPDIKSVGVMGDERTYQRPIILRAVESSDAMTADWAKLPYDVLARISGRIVAEVPGANRVCYDITSKPPATIEWE